MTIADYIAEELARRGIKYVFGIPGGPSIPYIEAFEKCGIEFILTSSETGAGIMADVTGRLTGIPGICHATFGPGAVNLASGIGGAFLDRSPVVAFTSEVPDVMMGRTSQMNIDHQALFRPLTKATYRLQRDCAGVVLAEAFALAGREYPGPVHIGLPADFADIEFPEDPVLEERPGNPPAEGVEYPGEALRKVLRNARRPVMAAGLTARRRGLGPAIVEFLADRPMPLVVTPMAKGLVPEDHPCYAGVLFHSLSGLLAPVYEDADLIIGIGYDPVEFNFESWVPGVPLISLDTVRADMPESLEGYQVTGDLEFGMELLKALMPGAGNRALDQAVAARHRIEDAFSSKAGGFGGFGPVAAMRILQEQLPEDAVVTSDVGSHLHLLGQFWKPGEPDNLIMTNGWSSMGFGLPAAVAAQLHHRNRTVVCVTGDGGLLMSLGELVTARRYSLPVKVIVMADRELNLIRLKQGWKGAKPLATSLYEGGLFQADRILGVRTIRAETGEEMRKAVKDSLAFPGPLVIEAVIDPAEYSELIRPQ